MSIQVVEMFDSQEVTVAPKSDAVLKYKAFYDEDLNAILAAVVAVIPTSFFSLPLIAIHPKHLGAGVWEIDLKYEYAYEPTFAFDTTGGTGHISTSKETLNVYPAPGFSAPNFGGAIGVTKDSVEGCDIIVPVYKSLEEYYFDNAVIDAAYKLTIFSLTGKVNNAPFREFAAGECLFEGARGRRRGTGKWEIAYGFLGSPNIASLDVGTITGIAKAGWNYLWFRHADFDSGNQLARKLTCAVVERVYDPGDFSLLGIGS